MPKMKTNRSLAKRVKITGTGKIMRRKAGMGHLLSGKRPKRKRRLRRDVCVAPGDMRRVKALLGRGNPQSPRTSVRVEAVTEPVTER